jgi:hypothetical protein
LIHADLTASATRPAIASMVGDFAVSDIGKRGLARADRLSVHVDSAGAAERLPAPELCSFQTKEVSDGPQERHRRVNPFQDPFLSVDGELHRIALAVSVHETPNATGNSVETISQRASRALRAIGVRSFCPVGDPV